VQMSGRLFSTIRKRPSVIMCRNGWSYPQEMIFPLEYHNFYEMTLPIPRNYSTILKKDYSPEVFDLCLVRPGHARHYKKHFNNLLKEGCSIDSFNIPMNDLKIKLQPFGPQ